MLLNNFSSELLSSNVSESDLGKGHLASVRANQEVSDTMGYVVFNRGD